MSVAGPGEVLVPASVRDIVSGAGISFADHGMHRLKGLEDEVRLFLVTGLDGNAVAPPLEADEAAERRRDIFPGPGRRHRKVILVGIAAASVTAAAIAWMVMTRGEPPALTRRHGRTSSSSSWIPRVAKSSKRSISRFRVDRRGGDHEPHVGCGAGGRLGPGPDESRSDVDPRRPEPRRRA